MFWRLLSIFFLCWTHPAATKELVRKGSDIAVEIVGGDTLVLKSGAQVRLVGLQEPKLPLGRRGFRPWPLGEASRRGLERLTLGRRLTLSYGGRETDRYGRLLAHLHDETGKWLQGEMLLAGMARVYSLADNRALVAEMLALERRARTARRGIWRHPFYAVRDAAQAGHHINSFQLV